MRADIDVSAGLGHLDGLDFLLSESGTLIAEHYFTYIHTYELRQLWESLIKSHSMQKKDDEGEEELETVVAVACIML